MVAGFQSQFPPICDWNPPTVPPLKKFRGSPSSDKENKKNKNKIFLSHKNKDRKIKRKNQTTVLSKKESSKGFQKKQAICQGYGTGDTPSEECYNYMRTNYAKFSMDYQCLLTRWLRNRNARWRMAGRLANLFHIWASDARQPTLALFENSAETRKGVFCFKKPKQKIDTVYKLQYNTYTKK